MKIKLMLIMVIALITAKATVYTTTGVDTWDANGQPPAGWITGHTINVNHSITDMTAYTLQMNDNITVNINSGGIWKIGGITNNLSTSTVTVLSGGRLELTSTLAWSGSTLDVQSGGLLRTNGATAASGGTITVNGTFFIDGNWTNDVAIGGTGAINYTGTKSGTGSFTSGTESLPVELISFTGNFVNNNVVLNWATASETESDHFKIMKSIDGVTFSQIGIVSAVGFSEQTLEYSYSDLQNTSGNVYYQLIEEDFNGTQQASEIIKIYSENPVGNIVSIHPNPAINQINVTYFAQSDSKLEVTIFDINGKLVQSFLSSLIKDRNLIKLNISKLNKGTYTVLIKGDFFVSSKIFAKK